MKICSSRVGVVVLLKALLALGSIAARPTLGTLDSVQNRLLSAGTQYWFVITLTDVQKDNVAWYQNNQGLNGGVWSGPNFGTLLEFSPDSPVPAIQLNSTALTPEPVSGVLFIAGLLMPGFWRAKRSNSRAVTGLAAAAALAAVVVTSWARQDPAAGRPELPSNLASKFQVVPGRALLATKIRVKTPPSKQAPPPCAADSSSTYYDTRITVPITVCTNLAVAATYDGALMPTGASITHYKLTSASAIPNLKISGLQFPILCSTSNGPWSAQLESDRMCIGICSPQNSLTVIGIPNLVQFFWPGQFNVPPLGADFKFVGTPTKIDSIDWGRCHTP